MAKALARTLGTDAAARQQLKAEALKKVDGDYDVLYQPFVAAHTDFGQHVAAAVAGNSSDTLTMPELLDRIPTLNLSVPVNIAKWDAATYAPLVVFIPAGYNERTATRVKAYNQDGNEHWLDAQKAPDFPVVVVGPSERVTSLAAAAKQPTAGPVSTTLPIGGNTTNLLLQQETDGGGGGGYTPLGTTGTAATPCRTDKQTEFLRSIWLADVSQYESWFLGDPELRLQLISPIGSGGTISSTVVDNHYTMGRGTIEDTYHCDARLFYWDKAFLGQVLAYVWLEEDFGDIADAEFTFGYPSKDGSPSASVKVTYKVANHDDEIAKGLIFFAECPSQGYYSANGGRTEIRWVTENRP
ncbi:DUF3103 family protein [Hymenobacter sp. H14-R3]|uniref:DUF3103 family protein n=1 Tax=Hymenobacter sp. H14-R3 TaxID=3046308 RepID=UPI0024BADFFC|nr:DUF3103 family protein [Hymenobacter sp. H14-R3]MDJ0366128.1 DUF3103 family protein [Hymenobacter sp. H14-R3]